MATLNQGLGVKAGGSGGGGGVSNMLSPQQAGAMMGYLPRTTVTANDLYFFGPYDTVQRAYLMLRAATSSTTTIGFASLIQLQPGNLFRLTPGASQPTFKGTVYIKTFTDSANRSTWADVILFAVDMSDTRAAATLPVTQTTLGSIASSGSLLMTNDEFTISLTPPAADTAYYLALKIDSTEENIQFGAFASFEQDTSLV